MKQIKYIVLLAFAATLLVACDLSDPGSSAKAPDGFELDDDSPAGLRIKKALEDYGVLFRYEFTDVDYAYNWTGSIQGMPYVLATDGNAIIKVIDYIEQEVFSIFPAGFIKEYMPPTILLVDSLQMEYIHRDDAADPPVRYNVYNNILGNVTSGSLTIGGVNEHFVGSQEIKEGLISIFVERLLANSKAFPWPDEFVKVTDDLYEQAMGGVASSTYNSNYPYWDGDFENVGYWSATIADGPTTWLGRGVLSPGRLGDLSYETLSLGGTVYELPTCAKGTMGNDFGNFVVFILTKTVAEKEAFYAYVASITTNGGVRYPHGGPAAAEAIKQKVQIVKNYFQEHVGIELKDPS
jgi:hypothetical protein